MVDDVEGLVPAQFRQGGDQAQLERSVVVEVPGQGDEVVDDHLASGVDVGGIADEEAGQIELSADGAR